MRQLRGKTTEANGIRRHRVIANRRVNLDSFFASKCQYICSQITDYANNGLACLHLSSQARCILPRICSDANSASSLGRSSAVSSFWYPVTRTELIHQRDIRLKIPADSSGARERYCGLRIDALLWASRIRIRSLKPIPAAEIQAISVASCRRNNVLVCTASKKRVTSK